MNSPIIFRLSFSLFTSLIIFPIFSLSIAGPEILNATYNANLSQFKLTFHETVQFSKIVTHGIFITTESNSPYISLVHAKVLGTSDSSVITVQLFRPKARRDIQNLGESEVDLFLRILPFSIYNSENEGNYLIENFPINYLPNNTAIRVDSVAYNANENKLIISFDKDLLEQTKFLYYENHLPGVQEFSDQD